MRSDSQTQSVHRELGKPEVLDYILFKKRICNRLRLKISPFADFSRILALLNHIELPQSPVKEEHLIYALLELINNSIRAQAKRDREDPIDLEFYARNGKLSVEIRDHGGGFDTKMLPYSLSQNISQVDLNSDRFLEYRERHDYKRFGMGLYMAKSTFSNFQLDFLDHSSQEVPYASGKAVGTRIRLYLEKRG
jgi:anti-sigma regulatory factor (Ser/Thr protein kinase)